MIDIRQILLESALKRGKRSNTFVLTTENGRPVFKVGSKAFTDPGEASLYRNTIGLKRYDEIIAGAPAHLQPSIGPAHYTWLEGMMNTLAEQDPTFLDARLERYSFEVKPGQIAKIRDEFKVGDQISGFPVFSDDSTILYRIRKSNKEILTAEETTRAFEQVFHMDRDALGTLFKRMQTLGNAEETSAFGKRLRALTFDPTPKSGIKDPIIKAMETARGGVDFSGNALDKGFEGIFIVRGSVLHDIARQEEKRAKDILLHYRGQTDEEALSAIASAKGQLEKLKKLKKMAATGGRAEAVRALGVVNERGEDVFEGMFKGDALFVPNRDFASYLRTFGIDEKTIAGIDIFSSAQNLKSQFGLQGGVNAGAITLRAELEPFGAVRIDPQQLTAFGGNIWDINKISAYSQRIFDEELDEFTRTGKLPEGYRRLLELQRDGIADEGELAVKTMENQRRAARILRTIDAGLPPTPELASEILEGIRLSQFRKEGKEAVPNWRIPAVQAHVMNLEAARVVDRDLTLTPRELAYRQGSWVMHEEQIGRLHNIHGTFDLDDMIRQNLRYNRETDAFHVIGIRSPTTFGEVAVMDFDPTKNIGYLRELIRHDPVNKARYGQLVDQRSLIEHMPRMRRRIGDFEAELQLINDEINAQRHALKSGAAGIDANAIIRELMQKRTVLSKRMARYNNIYSLALTKANMAPDDIDQQIIEMAKAIVPETDAEQLAYIRQAKRGPDGMLQRPRSPARIQFEDKLKPEADTWLKRNADVITEEHLLGGLLDVDFASLPPDWAYGLMKERAKSMGGVGKYVNLDMLINSLEGSSSLKESAVPGFEGSISDVIDRIVQGKEGEEGFINAVREMNAMIYGLGKHVAEGGTLPRAMLDERFGGSPKMFKKAIETFSPDFFKTKTIEDIISQDTFYDTAVKRFRSDIAENEEKISRSKLAFRESSAVAQQPFLAAEHDEAERIYQIYKAAQTDTAAWWDDYGVSDLFEAEEFELNKKLSIKHESAKVLQNELLRYTDDTGELTDEGLRIFGALLQNKRAKMAKTIHTDSLMDLIAYTEQYFALRQGHIESLELAAENVEDPVEAAALRAQAKAAREITKEGYSLAEFKASDYVMPDTLKKSVRQINAAAGGKRASRMGRAYEAAKTVAEPLYERGTKETFEKLVTNPLVRKGGLAAIGLTAFSFMWHKYRDRSPEEMGGPPLLPGGSAYEDMPRYPIYPEGIGNMDQTGGITYNVKAHGDFDPAELQASIAGITGGSVSGSYYNSHSNRIPRPRMSRRRDPQGLFESL